MKKEYNCKNCGNIFIRCSSQGNPIFCCSNCCYEYRRKQSKRTNKQYLQEYYQKNKDRIREKSYINYINNREKINNRSKEYRKTEHGKATLMSKKYNIPYNKSIELLKIKQCEICGSSEYMATDHCHQCGIVRGRLCYRCNRAIGALGDSVELLEKAVKYLKKHKHPGLSL